MSDLRLLRDISEQILESIARIERRFCGIRTAEDFLRDDDGIDRLDGIVLMLITIGENLKRFEKHGGKRFLDRHTEIDWKGAMGVRDFLSHHYFDLDAEVVHQICQDRMSSLKAAMITIHEDLQEQE